jgi:pimeloyl-ACP methyl ester carboxylesterase
MCARRFLAVIFFLTLVVVAAGFAIFQWGGNVLLREATPKGHFEAAEAGGGPDYAQASSWVARPGMAADPALWLPDGAAQSTTGEAAIFFIHPTTYLENDRWNAPLFAGGDTAFRTNLFVQSQASAFNGAGQIWAPRYRQAAYGAFLLDSRDAESALDFAYRDVAAAFDEFLKEAGDRPIILAGHSQGALHLMRLLRERKAQLGTRLVAAYVVGWPIDSGSDLPALGLPACRTADDTGCILSWMSFGDPANPSLILDEWKRTPGLTGGERSQKKILCVNPITGTENGAAPAAANPGTLVPSANLRSATLQAGMVGAHCDSGLLKLDGQIPAMGPFVLPGNNYHVYDYALFWGAIRRDAERRLAAWRG